MSKTKKIAPVKAGEFKELVIESLAPGGQGVAKVDGFPIFIDSVVEGDIIVAEVYDVRKTFALAKIKEIITASKNRIEPPCQVYDRCGGCQWQHMDYQTQIKAKQEIVVQSIVRIAGLEADLVKPIKEAEHQFRYRNKVQFPVAQAINDKSLMIGYYEKNSHSLVDIESCPVQPEETDHLLGLIKETLNKFEIPAYNEQSHTGLFRHILIRKSHELDEALVTLVVNLSGTEAIDDKTLALFKKIANIIMQSAPKVAGFCLNFNNLRGNRILSDNTICLLGSAVIEEVLHSKTPDRDKDSFRFRLSTNSFFQIHTQQTNILLDQVIEALDLNTQQPKPVIVDAYAGVGTIAIWLSEYASTVYAIEENPYAIADGRTNALLNGLTNIDFREGKAESILAKLVSDGIKVDALVIDPPRKGLSDSVINSVLGLAPDKIVYVSCNPSTLARDLKKLEAGLSLDEEEKEIQSGYKTLRVTPVDMFPQTYHVESVASLKKKDHQNGFVGNLEKI